MFAIEAGHIFDEFVKFFDIHDLGEYWSEMPEAHFEVDITRKTHLFALDPELANKVIEIAKGMSQNKCAKFMTMDR